MNAIELRIGNLVESPNGFNKVLEITEQYVLLDKNEGWRDYNNIKPIPISEEWLFKLSGIKYHKWIKYVHEFQNWYYWDNNKKEFVFNK